MQSGENGQKLECSNGNIKKKIKNNISGEKVQMRKNLIWEIYFPMHD